MDDKRHHRWCTLHFRLAFTPLFHGVKSAAIMVPLLIGITYMISLVLWRINRTKVHPIIQDDHDQVPERKTIVSNAVDV